MPWFELKKLKRSPDGRLLATRSDTDMFEAANAEAAREEASRRSRDLGDGGVAMLLDRDGTRLATYEAGGAATASGAPT